MYQALLHNGRRVRFPAQALDPRGEAWDGVDVITGTETGTVLMSLPTPFLPGC